jgi:diguanylate cyclase (GGDEF)-like protein
MSGDLNDFPVADPDQWQRARISHGIAKFAPVMPIGTLAGCVAIVVCLWPVTTRALLTSWFNIGLVLVTALWLAGHALHRRRDGALAENARLCRRWLLWSSLAAGAFWGVTSIVLLPAESPVHQSLLAFILVAVTALWLPLFALERATLATLAAPALLPMALILLFPPTAAPLAPMGSLLLLLFAAFLVAARIIKRMLDADYATHRALYHRATHDSLVGLSNHAEFHRCVAVLESAPTGPYAIVFIDLDHFKRINDTAGHGAGDRLLRQVGTILREEKRKTDVAARLGGDEFAVLMELCSDREALRVGASVLRRINSLGLAHGSLCPRMTASIGIACSADGAMTCATVLEAADRACYAAKRAGRNRIELATTRDDGSCATPLSARLQIAPLTPPSRQPREIPSQPRSASRPSRARAPDDCGHVAFSAQAGSRHA